jgi:hypothetical protein
MSGESAEGFLLPLLLGVSTVTFLMTLALALSPSEDDIREDERLRGGLTALALGGAVTPAKRGIARICCGGRPATLGPWRRNGRNGARYAGCDTPGR